MLNLRKLFFLLFFVFSYKSLALATFASFTLKNGMQIYINCKESLPIVSHVLLYKVGSANDPIGKSGLAHYLEHLMFKSTTNIENISKKINDLNAKYNAITSDYFTIYYQVAPEKNLSEVMQIESERMQNLIFSSKNAELEKDVVLQERNLRVDSNPSALLAEEMHAAFYRNDKSWNTIGWESEIKKLKTSDALAMYKNYYHPSNAVLILSGNFECKKAKELIERNYGSIKARRSNAPFVQQEPQHKSDLHVVMPNTINNERLVSYYFKAPNISDKSHAAVLVASYILGQNGWGKIYSELVDNMQLAQDVRIQYNYLTKSPGIFSITAKPINDSVSTKAISDGIENVMLDVLKNGVRAQELEIAKSSARYDLATLLDGVNDRTVWYAIALSVGMDINYFNNLATEVASVGLEQINSALSVLLSSKKVIGYLE